ncbi:hypothetical protein [Wenling hepe-like virus 2]|uniref:hypothetical protein n=1 Tax=Wenling hepe-like virus 2 TaxID=1923494 RepID=UPI00090A712B|nr:hypothetical protein [Wenling hepe-like virus 2]APG77831.1 hypothetical protein [Wenling hepe-like virus 2]
MADSTQESTSMAKYKESVSKIMNALLHFGAILHLDKSMCVFRLHQNPVYRIVLKATYKDASGDKKELETVSWGTKSQANHYARSKLLDIIFHETDFVKRVDLEAFDLLISTKRRLTKFASRERCTCFSLGTRRHHYTEKCKTFRRHTNFEVPLPRRQDYPFLPETRYFAAVAERYGHNHQF